jgi:peroxiredoxin Q/BCP
MFGFCVLALIAIGVAIAMRPGMARADMLKEGSIAPPFATSMVTGNQTAPVALSDFQGKRVVLYFYPKDETPGCTKEACAFRDSYSLYRDAGIIVLGCSIDSESAHRSFIQKYNLPFPLLLDPDKRIARSYGAANGIPILGLDRRVTYLINETGMIAKVYPNVDPSQHASEILKDAAAMATPTPAAPVPSDATPPPQ